MKFSHAPRKVVIDKRTRRPACVVFPEGPKTVSSRVWRGMVERNMLKRIHRIVEVPL